MKRLTAFVFILVFNVGLLGCKSEDPTPELKDPIFSDLVKQAKSYEEEYKSIGDEIVALRKKLETAEPHTIEKQEYQRNIARNLPKLRRADQMRLYFKIRAERRKLEARIAYKKAFQADKAWPDPKELEEYQISLRVREINPNWNDRVPKLKDRTPANLAKSAKAPQKKAH